MAIRPINGSALQGISRGLDGMRKNAAEIARPRQSGTAFPTKDQVRAMVELHQNAQRTTASVKVLQTADQMIGSLLDVKA
jgi:hypothetical protein